MENENTETEVGELIAEPHLTAADSDVQIGDHVYFRVRHPAFRHLPAWPELCGEVLRVLPGFELAYQVKIVTVGRLTWPDRFVRRGDVTKVWVPDW